MIQATAILSEKSIAKTDFKNPEDLTQLQELKNGLKDKQRELTDIVEIISQYRLQTEDASEILLVYLKGLKRLIIGNNDINNDQLKGVK